MRPSKKISKCAFFGIPGAGKSTCVQLLSKRIRQLGGWVRCIRFAEPLYEAQQTIYRLAGRQLQDKTIQDGKLLNFLGAYFRQINKNALIERFSATEALYLEEFQSQDIPTGLLLNDDMRVSEADFLKSRQFLLIQILADPKICRERRSLRGDVTLGSELDTTERGIENLSPDASIVNNGQKGEFEKNVISFLNELLL